MNSLFKNLIIIALLNSLGGYTSQAQKKNSMKDSKSNPLLCDPETGVCEIDTSSTTSDFDYQFQQKKLIKIIYFTDPICSSCWGIEPQLRKLKLEYGKYVEIEYRMGGLLPDWSYNSGGISKPSDVAHHWDEVSAYYDMPIDGDVWLENPLASSYPPSIAFKAAQLQDEAKAQKFMRRMREMVFLEKKNIADWNQIKAAAIEVGLDADKIQQDYAGKATELFKEDLMLARKMGVRGFPTLYVNNSLNNTQVIYGFRPYALFETTLRSLAPAAFKDSYDSSWEGLFAKYPTLTAREFSELSGKSRQESESLLKQLTQEGKLKQHTTKNGSIWKVK